MSRLSLILTFLCFAQWASETYSLGSGCTAPLKESKQTEYWLSKIDHIHDQTPFNPIAKSYKVFRNVKEFGAKGDGTTDDTDAINEAISSGNRCGVGCGETTISPAIIYFPPGKYLISKPIVMLYFTQLIGDGIQLPTLVMDKSFKTGIGMLDSDPYLQGGAQPFVNQDNFYRQVRNFNIDLTQAPANYAATGIHWQVAQATSITNVHFKMSTEKNNRHRGIWMENGSGGFMSDLTFEGGEFALWVGNQQFTSRNLTVKDAHTAVYMNWNWGWTFKSLSVTNCQVAFEMTAGGADKQGVGSVIIMDSQFTDTPTGVLTGTSPTSGPPGAGALILDNVKLTNVKNAVASPQGKVILEGGTKTIASWGQGHVYDAAGTKTFHQADLAAPAKPAVLIDSKNPNKIFFERSKPTYLDVPLSEFVSVVGEGARGDGKTDDTKAIAATIAKYAGCKIIYFPEGEYLISDTIVVPPGSRLIGEAWSTISAHGQAFSDQANPKPMFQIGKPGDTGIAELSELVFSNLGAVPGAILLEINMKEPAGQQGAVGLWDVHFRLGGSKGTNLQGFVCDRNAPIGGKVEIGKPECFGAFLLLHIAPTASAYLENVWAWVADHDIDGKVQLSIYNGRGILSESADGPVWMYGTASEHSVLYQYNIVNSKNVIMAMIQTETPYFQSNPPAPKPLTLNTKYHDPDFSHCAANSKTCPMAWGLRVVKSSDIYLYGAGLYNFFQNYDQGCLKDESCQDFMTSVEQSPNKIYFYNLNTKASQSMLSIDNKNVVSQADNRASFCSTIAAFLEK